MNETIKKYNLIGAIVIFIGLPLLFYTLGDFPRRTLLKESLSILTLLAFFLMLGQFFLARSNRSILKVHKMSRIVNLHKIIGYIFVPILLLHPFLIVVPRYFEAGITPGDALRTMLTTFSSPGIILGMSAWCLMLVLGVTSFLRHKIGMDYKTWRVFHGMLAILFIVLATWHVITLGRHSDGSMSVFLIILATGGVLLLLKLYIFESTQKTGDR